MTTFTNPTTLLHSQTQNHHQNRPLPAIRSSISGDEKNLTTHRRKVLTTLLTTTTSLALGLHATTSPVALAQNWGTRSFLKEKFFEPGLSPEDAVARIRQTAEGLHSIRDMLETMSWRYVLFYIRLKQSYLSQDMQNALSLVPESRKQSYINAANDLVENMVEFDYYVRTPKVYESYLYYEKTLKAIDELVGLLA
ncbi:Photosynthetic NDH subunit of lumenal location 2 like [Actinidia chinensis var. chinensis]|uniref:Photosynthetic NDH subunit of lumenal location 2 like n=1 Tax=Actinidia chinensis var. chinensis TaxID=1590841 RepID=A0A2R6QQV8_ACTCC|nr:Photosynthetic NDH subunit of lumenal location 2 like [Actinidia chinensis var. chinensis]